MLFPSFFFLLLFEESRPFLLLPRPSLLFFFFWYCSSFSTRSVSGLRFLLAFSNIQWFSFLLQHLLYLSIYIVFCFCGGQSFGDVVFFFRFLFCFVYLKKKEDRITNKADPETCVAVSLLFIIVIILISFSFRSALHGNRRSLASFYRCSLVRW